MSNRLLSQLAAMGALTIDRAAAAIASASMPASRSSSAGVPERPAGLDVGRQLAGGLGQQPFIFPEAFGKPVKGIQSTTRRRIGAEILAEEEGVRSLSDELLLIRVQLGRCEPFDCLHHAAVGLCTL
jgi:hypothetical protein